MVARDARLQGFRVTVGFKTSDEREKKGYGI